MRSPRYESVPVEDLEASELEVSRLKEELAVSERAHKGSVTQMNKTIDILRGMRVDLQKDNEELHRQLKALQEGHEKLYQTNVKYLNAIVNYRKGLALAADYLDQCNKKGKAPEPYMIEEITLAGAPIKEVK